MLTINPEVQTAPSMLTEQYVKDIAKDATKDSNMIQLQQWAIEHCGWVKPEE